MALNFIAMVPAIIIQLSMIDNESSNPPIGDKLPFNQYITSPRYWSLLVSSMFTIGVCHAMNDYNGYDELLGEDRGSADTVFWVCDMGGRYFGGIIVYLLASYINEYIWALVYSVMGFLGTFVILAMTMTDKVERSPYFVWGACVLLGTATGGWWQIAAQTILDDSGF